MPADDIQYSDRYTTDDYEYRHVILPPDLARIVPRTHLLSETEWRNLGVQQSPGWVHYMFHPPEPHVLCFRRKKPKDETVVLSQSQSQNLISQQSQQSQISVSENSKATSTTSTNAVICA